MIVWDEPKRLANLVKHDLDFAEFEAGFDFATAVAVPAKSSQTGRPRSKLIGSLHGRLVVAAIVSQLGTEALALVGFRPASSLKRMLYGRH
jgi:uncharacterized DUF497 family protein